MDLIQEYLNGYLKPDAFGAVLADDAIYAGPMQCCKGRDELVPALSSLAKHCEEIDVKKIFANDNEVCAVYDLVSAEGTRRVVDVIVVRDDKIQSIDQTFDATQAHRRNCEI